MRNSSRKPRWRAESRTGGAGCRAVNRVNLRSDFVRSSRFEDWRRQALDEASTGETLADLRQLPVVEDGEHGTALFRKLCDGTIDFSGVDPVPPQQGRGLV